MAGNELARADFQQDGAIAPAGVSHQTAVAQTRAAQEVQAAMVIAQRFPRDPVAAENRIVESCKRTRLAEKAFYSYRKGGSQIFGPSVHLARMMAAHWGNCQAGWTVLEQDAKHSVIEAFCWDYETNTKQTITFTVEHRMKSGRAAGGYRELDDPRDIYEHCANMAARRVRACILAIIPGEVQDAAIDQCEATLKDEGGDTPLIDRVKVGLRRFQEKFGVTQDMIEKFFGHKIEAMDETEYVRLKGIWTSLIEGASSREDWFEIAPLDDGSPGDPDDLTPGKKQSADKSDKSAKEPEDAPESSSEPETRGEPGEDLFGEPDPQQARSEAEQFYENDVNPDGPAGEHRITAIKQLLDLKLADSGQAQTARNRNRLAGFAALGLEISDINNPTNAEADALLPAIKALTQADVNEALTAE